MEKPYRKPPKLTFDGPPAKVIKDFSKRKLMEEPCTVYGTIHKIPGYFFGGLIIDDRGNEMHYKGKTAELKEALRNMKVGQKLGLFGAFRTFGFVAEKYNPNIE